MVNQEIVNLKDGVKINIINDYIGSLIKSSNGYFEEELLTNFIDYIPNQGVIYDIGANIGNHTLFFSKYMKPNRIFSFEPSKELFEVLTNNIRINKIDNVQLYNSAVGEKEEKGILNFNTTNSGASNIEVKQDGNIQIIKIDNLEIESPDFIKIDVEGFEYNVLKGMNKTLQKNRPVIWIEIQDENYYNVDSFLNEHGYIQIDRWLDNYIYIKPDGETSLQQVVNKIKNKPFQRLNSKIREINLKYRNITLQNKTLQTKINTLEQGNLVEKNKNIELNHEVKELRQTIPYLKEQIEIVKAVNISNQDSLIKELKSVPEKEINSLEIKIAEYKSDKAFLLNQIEDLKQRLNNSEEFLQLYYQEKTHSEILKSKLEILTDENNDLREEVNKNCVLQEKFLELKQLAETKEKQVTDTMKKNDSLENEVKVLNNIATEKESQIEEITEKNANLEQLVANLEEKLNYKNIATKDQENTINLLKNEIKQLDVTLSEKMVQISELTKNNVIYNQKINHLEIDFNEKEKNLKQFQDEIKQKNKKIVDLEDKINHLQQQYSDSQERLNSKKNEIEKVQAEIQIKSDFINQLKRERELLVAENVDLKSEIENEIIDKIRLINNEEIFTLKLENQLVLNKKSELEKAALNNKIIKMEKKLNAITKKYNALSSSKLGKLTTKYWTFRKQMIRGK
ncbi:FkbM family methyltransferase [Bacillus salipaludis]|uniref:FkbM family methyltransferase n=1 Tax=Bacillus salipaludis TaxID=2547811 RepID=A0AA90R860_9BACI|nr:FkbM family methyltransferase [Bacillus salipaludis]MDQ6600386.1 FkbM family methyltransferase [Bacillus salipaludis]